MLWLQSPYLGSSPREAVLLCTMLTRIATSENYPGGCADSDDRQHACHNYPPHSHDRDPWMLPNALVQLQARYNHCGEAASEKCLSAATFVRQPVRAKR
jgi:hypothetical protein